MGDPISALSIMGLGVGAGVAAKKAYDMMTEIPPVPKMPAPVEEVDAESKRKYMKERMKSRNGHASTILATKNSGSKKTVLG